MAMSVGTLLATLKLKDNLSGPLNAAAKKMRAFGAKTQRIGKQLASSFTLPIIGMGFAAIKASETVDEAMRAITVGTGAAGATLDGLKGSFTSVFQEVPQSADTVATVIADMNTILGATGPTLETLTKRFLDGSRVMGMEAAPNAIKFARVIKQFGIPAEEAANTLDMFFATSQRTGMSLEDLIAKTGDFAVVLGNAGFSLEESAALFGSLSSAGIPVTRIMPGLNAAFRRWAKEGLNAADMLGVTIDKLKATTDPMDRLNMATEAFGAEGAQRLMKAVEAGVLNLDDMTRAIEGTQGAVENFTRDNETLADVLGTLRNKATTALAPLGQELKNALVGFLPVLERMFIKLNEWGAAFGRLSPETRNLAIMVAGVTAAIGPILIAVGALSASVGAIIPIFTGAAAAIGALTLWPAILGAAFIALVLKVKPFRDLLMALGKYIKSLFIVSLETAKQKIVEFIQPIIDGISWISKWLPGMDDLSAGLDWMTQKVEGATGELDAMRDQTEAAVVVADEFEGSLVNVEQAAAAVVPQVRAIGSAADEAAEATSTLTKAEQALQDRISGKNLQAEIDSLNNVLTEMGGNAELTRAEKHRLGAEALKLSETLGSELTPQLKEAAAWMYKNTRLADDAKKMLDQVTSATDRNSLSVAAKTRNDRVSNLILQNVADSVKTQTAALQTNETQTFSVREAMGSLDSTLGEASQAFSNLANIAGDSFGGLFKKAGLVIGKVQALSKTVQSVSGAFGSIKKLTGLFGKLTGSLGGANGAAGGLSGMLGKITAGVGPMAIGLGVAAGAIALISKGFKSAADRANNYRSHIEKMNAAVAGSGTAAAEAANKVRQAVGGFGTGSTEFMGQSGEHMGNVPGFQQGTGGRFVDFGRGSLAMLHGREAITPEGTTGPSTEALARQIKGLRDDLRTDRTFQMQLVPKMLAATMQQAGVI